MLLATSEVQFVFRRKKRYSFCKFLGDLFMIALTGGLWLIWMIIRHIRNH